MKFQLMSWSNLKTGQTSWARTFRRRTFPMAGLESTSDAFRAQIYSNGFLSMQRKTSRREPWYAKRCLRKTCSKQLTNSKLIYTRRSSIWTHCTGFSWTEMTSRTIRLKSGKMHLVTLFRCRLIWYPSFLRCIKKQSLKMTRKKKQIKFLMLNKLLILKNTKSTFSDAVSLRN